MQELQGREELLVQVLQQEQVQEQVSQQVLELVLVLLEGQQAPREQGLLAQVPKRWLLVELVRLWPPQ